MHACAQACGREGGGDGRDYGSGRMRRRFCFGVMSHLTDCDGAQVEPLGVLILVHVVVVERSQVAHGQRHLVVLLAQELLLDLYGLDVHLFSLLTQHRKNTSASNSLTCEHAACAHERPATIVLMKSIICVDRIWHYTMSNSNLELAHGLVKAAQVAVVFGCLDVELPEGFFGQLEGGEVQVVSLLQ